MKLEKFIPLMKVDEKLRQVWGVAAAEMPDRAKEIMDYALSKPRFAAWSEQMQKASQGKSLGNVRAMHGKTAAGKLVALDFDDGGRRVLVGAEIVDPVEWEKVEKGVYTGFSIGGDYGKRWSDPEKPGYRRYEAIPLELSLVDVPCIPGAQFEVIKVDGGSEMRMFAEGEPTTLQKKAYPWEQCISDQTERYGSEETARKVCGMIRSKYGKAAEGELNNPQPDIVFEGDLLMEILPAIEKELGIKPVKVQEGEAMVEETQLGKAAADPARAIAMVQALRDESEQGGDLESAALFTQAIALLIQAGIEESETPEEESAETPEQQAAEAALASGTTGEGTQPPVGEMQQAAKVGNLKKAGRTFSTQNVASMHNVIRSLAGMLAAAGDPVAQKVSECYKTDAVEAGKGQTGSGPQNAPQEQAVKALLSGELEKVFGNIDVMNKSLEKLTAEFELLKRQPLLGGPAMRQGTGAAEKVLPGGLAQPVQQQEQKVKPKIDELRKNAAIEPDPVKRAEYMRQLLIAEQATLIK